MISEEITLEGHIIDWPVLTKVLDGINSAGGGFRIIELHIGRTKAERSHATIEVSAPNRTELAALLERLKNEGALVRETPDAEVQVADMDGAFPEAFYSSTNIQTYIRHKGDWCEVQDQEMDCGIVHDPRNNTFRCVPIANIRKGDRIVCGHRGIKTASVAKEKEGGGFEFMSSEISTEKPKNAIIRNCAQLMHRVRQSGQKLLIVGGPAIVHTGASEHLEALIRRGYCHVLFAGNALATHDMEQALYGTSLGVYLANAAPAHAGHEHHLRAINTIRRCGNIRAAVDKGVLKSGIMHACIRHDVEYVLAGSIRDDGPLPDVITDALQAQDRMRELIKGVGFVLMVATTLHSVATGNILPAWIPCVCVDISPSVLTKLADRGSWQTIGLVTDVEPFFRELIHELDVVEHTAAAAS